MVKLNKKTREQYIKSVLDSLDAKEKQQFRETFLALHPSDQVDVFVTLNKEARNRLYEYLTPEEFAEIFGGLKISTQKKYFLELDELYAFETFNYMFTDDIADFLAEINPVRAEAVLQQIEKEQAEKVRALLAYEPETAGAIMTKELISISSTDVVEQVLVKLREEAQDAELIYYLYVVDKENMLVGVVSLRDLIVAPPDEVIEKIMSTRVISVPEDMDQEKVGHVIKKYDLLAVPVISKQSSLLGIITVDDVMDILEAEATEDFGEISAAKGATDLNLSSFEAAKKRAPWIMSLMIFGLITASVIGRFEATLEAVVLLAVFMPMIMDSAGNVGTQSLAVAVRGLALGTIEKGGFWRMIRREFNTGLLIGILSMALITVLITVLYGDWLLAFVVGVSILCTLSVSAVVGTTVPIIINKLKLDPAIASGPFITTVNDILGLLIYFSIATRLMQYL